MAFDATQLRDAIRPQDGFAVLIMLLGLAIVLFLEGAAIKLIGGSIAALGAVALYMTVIQRVNDQVQIRTRKSTLPPPAFKTRVTQDPATSTKRIHFDDFRETYDPVDDEIEQVPLPPGESFRVVAAGDEQPADSASPGSADSIPLPATLPRETFSYAPDDESEVTPRTISEVDGSFRVIPLPSLSRADSTAAAEPQTSGDGIAMQQERGDLPARSSNAQQPPEARPAADEPPVAEPAVSASPVAVASEAVHTERVLTRTQVQNILEDLVSQEEEPKGSEPRGEFVRLVGQVLNAVARSLPARSIVFFWVNLEKGHLIPEAQVTSGSHEIRTGTRIAVGNDVISQIARSGIPEILTDISTAAERELIPYYASPSGAQSFVGVPVFFRREVVGVLAADSAEDSGFDAESVAILAEYTRLIAGLIRGYTEKYDLHLTARTLEVFEELHGALTGRMLSPARIASVLVEQIAPLFDHHYIAAVVFDAQKHDWKIAAHSNDGLMEELNRLEPDMQESLVGYTTRFAEEVYLESVDRHVRFCQGEPVTGAGAFISIPLIGSTKCYGALVMEHAVPGAYIPRDIELLRNLVRFASMAIEVYNVNRAIERQSVLDEVSGLYNSDFLLSTLDREILRAREHRSPLAFCLVSIDIPQSLHVEAAGEMEDFIVHAVAETVAASLRPYDVVGRYNARTFGVVLAGRNDQDAYLWAERLRKEVAGRILSAAARKFSVTVSVGICDMSDSAGSTVIIDGASRALEKARGGEGNAVILY